MKSSKKLGVSINPTATRSFSAKPNQMAAKGRRCRSLSMASKKLDIKSEQLSLSRAKAIISEMSVLVHKIIEENESTPDIQSALRPLINGIDKGYPRFHGLGTQFFAYVADRRAAKSRQAFSTAPIIPAMQEFTKYWDPFISLVDQYNTNRPLPHAKEISLKFKSIAIFLDRVLDSNLSRKYPSKNITNSVHNLQTLSDQLDVTITSLYMNDSFAHFKDDIADMYVNDVQAITNLLTNAFKFDFIQCGLTAHEYQRVKIAIMTNCSTIINALKASFSFIKEIGKTLDYITRIKNEIQWVIDEVNSRFCVFRPGDSVSMGPEPRKEKAAPVVEEPKVSPLMQFVGENEDFKMDSTETKIRMFLHEVMPTLHEKYIGSGDIWEMLDTVEKRAKFYDERIKQLETELQKKNAELGDVKNNEYQREVFFKQNMNAAKETFAKNKENYKKVLEENAVLIKSRDSMLAEINAKQEILDKMIMRGDPIFLRNSLISLSDKIAEKIGETRETKNDKDLVDFTLSAFVKMEEKHQREIDELKKEMEEKESKYQEKEALFVTKFNEENAEQQTQPQQQPQHLNKPSVNQSLGNVGRKQRTQFESYKEAVELNMSDFVPVIEMLDSVTGMHFAEEPMTDVNAMKEIVGKEIDIITTALKNLADKLALKTSSFDQINEFLREKGCKGENPKEEVSSLLDNLNSSISPLKETIQKQDKEIESLKEKVSVFESRIKAIARSTKADIPQGTSSVQIFDIIQDNNAKNVSKMEKCVKTAEKLRNCLKEVETTFVRILEPKDGYSKNDDDLINNVLRYTDNVCDQSYAQNFVSTEDLNSLFSSLKNEFKVNNPHQYIPVFVKKYTNMKKAIEALEPIDQILQTIMSNISQSSASSSSIDKAFIKANLSSASGILANMNTKLEERTIANVLFQCMSILAIVI